MNPQERMQREMFDREIDNSNEQNMLAMGNQGAEEIYLQQQDQREDLTKWQQTLLTDLNMAIHELKNEIQNDEGEWESQLEFTGKYETQDGKEVPVYKPMKPKLNDKGISFLKSQIMPCISKNLINSNYTEEFIMTRLKSILRVFRVNLAYYYSAYDIEKGNLEAITSIFKSLIEPTYFRCLKGGERQLQREIRKVVEAVSLGRPAPTKKTGGFMNNLFGG